MSTILSLLFGLRYAECLPSLLTEKKILVVFAVGLVPAVLGQVLSEYPSGPENAMLRLGTSMFARSGMPMVAVLVLAGLDKDFLALDVLITLMSFYGIGLFLGLYLEVGRLNRLTPSRGDAC